MKTNAKLWAFLAALAFLTPLGFLLPEHFKAGAAWGEWGLDELRKALGYLPQGLEKLGGIWKAPLSGYGPNGFSAGEILTRIVFAVLGAGLAVLLALGIGTLLVKKGKGAK